jgi:hypothetical protein
VVYLEECADNLAARKIPGFGEPGLHIFTCRWVFMSRGCK